MTMKISFKISVEISFPEWVNLISLVLHILF